MQYAYLAPYFRENLSYHHCKSISDTAMYANPAGTEEIFIVNTFTDFDKEVFFAVRATDGANEAEESNIVSVFIASITTTTSKGSFNQSYEIKSPPWTILWFRIREIFSVENIDRLGVFMFQTSDNSQLCIDSQFSPQ